VAGQNQAKSSVVRGIRASILENYPSIEHHLDDIIPKKDSVTIIKCREHIEIISLKNEFLFFRQRDGPYVPTLHLLHKYPNMLPWLQVDRGAIKFILSGANIMAPGLTSAGAKMDTDLPENVIVAIMAEGKEHSLCVGMTKMSTDNIRLTNKGVAVESLHYLCDGLWDMISKR
jgi:PUA domain protein